MPLGGAWQVYIGFIIAWEGEKLNNMESKMPPAMAGTPSAVGGFVFSEMIP